MIPVVELIPRDAAGEASAILRLDPRDGVAIKDDRDACVWRQKLPDGTAAVVKMYFGRKLLRWKERGWYTSRVEREFRVLANVHRHGIPCSPPLFWGIGCTHDGRTGEVLATREIPAATDAKTWLKDPSANRTASDVKPLFAMLARLHRAGIMHGALLARNLLVSEGHFFLIDMPRAETFGTSIEGRLAGRFDLLLLLANMNRFVDDRELAGALAGYPAVRGREKELVATARNKPIGKYRRILLRDYFLLQAAWSRLTNPMRGATA